MTRQARTLMESMAQLVWFPDRPSRFARSILALQRDPLPRLVRSVPRRFAFHKAFLNREDCITGQAVTAESGVSPKSVPHLVRNSPRRGLEALSAGFEMYRSQAQISSAFP